MTYASPWFGTLYAVAFVTGIALLVAGERLDRRVVVTLGTLVAAFAGLTGGMAVKGMTTDVSGEPFALQTALPAAMAIPPRLGPANGRASQLSVDVFADGRHAAGAPQSLTIPLADDVVAAGWAFDANDRARCAAVALVVDGRTFPAAYGGTRTDVASIFGPDHLATGYRVVVGGTALGLGRHRADLRCLNAAGASFASPPLLLEVSR
jgi:hypothetical protein